MVSRHKELIIDFTQFGLHLQALLNSEEAFIH